MAFKHLIGRAFALTTLSVGGGLLALHVSAAPPPKVSNAEISATLTIVPKGGSAKVGGYYMPQRLTLSKVKPAHLKKEPKYAGTPQYGILHFGDAKDNGVIVVLDEDATGATKLYVDSNHDGDLTNDPAIEWKRSGTAANTLYMGNADVLPRMARGKAKTEYGLTLYRFSPATAKARNLPPETLFFYRDYAATGEVMLDGKKYPLALMDELATGHFDTSVSNSPQVITELNRPVAPLTISSITPVPMKHFPDPTTLTLDWNTSTTPATPPAPRRLVSLLIDRDGDGRFDSRYERYDVGKPFNIAGKTYEVSKISADGTHIDLKAAKTQVAEVRIPPSLRVGVAALAFDRPMLNGKTVSFPHDYKGKVVMLDFWATWCGPCKAELPGLIKTYKKYHDQGFDIVGISLDQENMKAKVAEFLKTNDMAWPQVYDGKFWKADVAVMYGIDSIPHAFLVDGDTGKILADGNGLRGAALDGTIAKAVAAKSASKAAVVASATANR